MCLLTMLGNHVGCTYVATSVTLYRSAMVDLSRSRSVHALEHEPCCPDPVRLSGTTCNAVHYGLCSPLLKLPAFCIPPPPVSPPVVPNCGTSVTLSAAVVPHSPVVTTPVVVTPTTPPPVVETNKVAVEVFDPFDLLSADLEDKLEALVTTFVAQDKVRLAASTRGRAVKADGVQFGDVGRVANRFVRRDEPRPLGEPSPRPSPEYRQSGVQARISKYAAKTEQEDPPGYHATPAVDFAKSRKVPDSGTPVYNAEFVKSLNLEDPPGYNSGFSKPINLGHDPPAYHITPEFAMSRKLLEDPPGYNVSSAVDYAKSRLKQQEQRGAESKVRNGAHPLDKECKLPWEPEPVTTRRSPERDGSPSIPHPKLTSAQKAHIRERSLSPTQPAGAPPTGGSVPVRPFLTKGSVAERVMLFERCPTVTTAVQAVQGQGTKGKTSPLYSSWRAPVAGGDAVAASTRKLQKDKENVEPGSPETGSLRRLPKSATRATHNLPRFYYPSGKPAQDPGSIEEHLKKIGALFSGLQPTGRAASDKFGLVAKVCGLPLYWKCPLFHSICNDKKGLVTSAAFLEYWRRVQSSCHDEASRFVKILSRGLRNYLIPDDFTLMIQDMIDTHPGLMFLKEAPEFHSRYVHTVIARIFYCVNRSWTGKITIPELRKSNFLRVLRILEEEEDINQITEYFSYEHFYVIYCKFWELDKDHDLYIDKMDLARHNDGALSSRIIDRIFSGAVTRGSMQKKGRMSYSEFVWFLISEEDKRHPRSIEYWFRCMDLDGDGFLSMYELEYFYEEQLQRMEALGIETLPFKDCLCQMLDMIRPKVSGQVSLADLKWCKMTPVFFDTFFNLEKYLDHEQRDPFASQRDQEDGLEISDWDRYAAEEYELLVAEENANDQAEDLMYEEFNDSELTAHLNKMASIGGRHLGGMRGPADLDDDDYDYADSDAEYHY